MKKKYHKRLKEMMFLSCGLAACALADSAADRSPSLRPNIVLIYTDDLGYGDISCQGAVGVKTPNIDSLARDGLTFLNGHSASAVCTPSRYSLLTGEYSFRNPRAKILPGDAPALISPETFTLADVMKQAGYATAAIGKWHLGLGDGNMDWNGAVKPGPLEIGFDYSFLIPATGDRTPCVFLENHHVYNLDPADPITVSYDQPLGEYPIGSEHPELLKLMYSHGHDQTIVNGISRIGYMSGGKTALWKDEDFADVLTGKACSFMESNQDHPFFLYFATHDIHVPRMPHSRFRGKSSMGLRGDAIVQLDWCVGRVLQKLDELNLTDNTMVIFTSDNGPVLDDGYQDQALELVGDHEPGGVFRGGKASQYEGGTRVPLLIRWPAVIPAGETSEALIAHMDFAASFASLLGVKIPAGQCEDSENHLNALLGKTSAGRTAFVEEGHGGLAIISNGWKYCAPGRITDRITTPYQWQKIQPPGELYNLRNDPQEKVNAAGEYPEKLQELSSVLEQIKARKGIQ